MKKLNVIITCFFLIFSTGTLTGCAGLGKKLKALVGGKSTPKKKKRPPSYSKNKNQMNVQQRKYQRVTAESLRRDSDINPEAGSLWKMEGQGSYLFSQNNLRVLGDIINVKIEGKDKTNLSKKVLIVKKALERMKKLQRLRDLASEKEKGKEDAAKPPEVAKKPTKKDSVPKNFGPVASRVVEKKRDGSYRIKGSENVFIGEREYKLIVTGIVRPDDISDSSVKSTKMMDSKFDLVTSNRDTRGYK